MSEFQIGARQRAQYSPPPEGGASQGGASQGSTGGRVDSSEISDLGALGALELEDEGFQHTGPHTLDTAVEALEREVLELLVEATPQPNEGLKAQIAAGPGEGETLGSDDHLARAREREAAWLPLPKSLATLEEVWFKDDAKAREAINAFAEELQRLNEEISAYVHENELTNDQIRSLLRVLTTPKSFKVLDQDEVKEENARKVSGAELFGELYATALNRNDDEARKSFKDLFNKRDREQVVRGLVGGAFELLHQEADRLGLVRHKDPEERKQALSLGVLRIVGEVGAHLHRWPPLEQERWMSFVEKVREAVLHHPEEALEALLKHYQEENE